MDNSKTRRLVSNTIYMYMLSITKLIIPLISLPYLTRVLSVDVYGGVSFVKSIVSYLQIIVDFGFLYSGTKEIIEIMSKKKRDIDRVIGDIFYAQLLLSGLAVVIMLICSLSFDVLNGFELYSMLSVVTVILSIFLFEYVFRATERMAIIAIRFAIMKILALVLTLIFVKSDADIILIPIFDIISSLIAIIPIFFQLKRMEISWSFSFKRIRDAIRAIGRSFEYFITGFFSVVFLSFNTIIIGVVLTRSDVAHWALAMNLVNAVIVLYNPIINSVYPTMTKNKDLRVVHKILFIYAPIIFWGCVLSVLLADKVVVLAFTEEYAESAKIFKFLLPPIVMAFPIMLYGIPCLGAINKQKLNIVITSIATCVHVLSVGILLILNIFTISNLIAISYFVGSLLCVLRVVFVYKNKQLFKNDSMVIK